jgi:DNA replication and repair protein RecF
MALKEMHYGRKQSLLEWDRQIAGFSSFIVQKRLDALRKIGFLAGVLHRRLTGGEEKLTLSYHRSYGLEKLTQPEDQMQAEWYFQCLQEHLEQDIYRMNTSVGPHRMICPSTSMRPMPANTVPRDNSERLYYL